MNTVRLYIIFLFSFLIGSFSIQAQSDLNEISSLQEVEALYNMKALEVTFEKVSDPNNLIATYLNSKDTIEKTIFFVESNINQLLLDSLYFKSEIVLIKCQIEAFEVTHSTLVEGINLFENDIDHVGFGKNGILASVISLYNNIITYSLFDNTIEKQVQIGDEVSSSISLDGNTFRNIQSKIILESDSVNLLFNKKTPYRNQLNIGGDLENPSLYLSNNLFEADDMYQTVMISLNANKISITDNTFESTLDFAATTVSGQVNMYRNEFHKISFASMSFSETYNLIEWDDIKNNQIIQTTSRNIAYFNLNDSSQNLFFDQANGTRLLAFYEGRTAEELSYMPVYEDYIRNYYNLYSNAKQNGNIRDANSIYFQMQEIERRLLLHNLKQDWSFKNLFRYSLSSLMSFYTYHGTDPSRAILVSFYIILLFGLFYSFFPSDWDNTPKHLLLDNFNSLVKKDGSYLKPLFLLIGSLLFSLLNGFILSINSFVTLGFGKIPTQGISKYACIIQGFLGWFLLTLFTVTLLNQIQY